MLDVSRAMLFFSQLFFDGPDCNVLKVDPKAVGVEN